MRLWGHACPCHCTYMSFKQSHQPCLAEEPPPSSSPAGITSHGVSLSSASCTVILTSSAAAGATKAFRVLCWELEMSVKPPLPDWLSFSLCFCHRLSHKKPQPWLTLPASCLRALLPVKLTSLLPLLLFLVPPFLLLFPSPFLFFPCFFYDFLPFFASPPLPPPVTHSPWSSSFPPVRSVWVRSKQLLMHKAQK